MLRGQLRLKGGNVLFGVNMEHSYQATTRCDIALCMCTLQLGHVRKTSNFLFHIFDNFFDKMKKQENVEVWHFIRRNKKFTTKNGIELI